MGRVTPVRLHVGEAAVAAIATAAALRVPGVVALRSDLRSDLPQALLGRAGSVLGRGQGSRRAGVDAVVDDDHGTTDLRVTIVTRLGHNCRDLANAVQQSVTQAVTAQSGLAARVHVTVAEVVFD